MSQGAIQPDTPVSRGDSGVWSAARTFAEVLVPEPVREIAEVQPVAAAAPSDAWRFMKDGRRMGPVSFAVLEHLARSGGLEADDLVWSPDRAVWMPAEQVEGLIEPSPTPLEDPSPPESAASSEAGPGEPIPAPTWTTWGIAVIPVVLIVVAIWLALNGSSADDVPIPDERIVEASAPPAAVVQVLDPPAPRMIEKQPEPVPVPVPIPVAGPIDEPITESPPRAPGAARPGLAVGTDPALPPVTPPLQVADRPLDDVADVAEPVLTKPITRTATIDGLLEDPDSHRGRSLVLEGVFKVGTKILDPTDKQGTELGSTIWIARNDGRTVCTLEGRVHGLDLHMILDPRLAGHLHRLFG
jgi:hypothetical protein